MANVPINLQFPQPPTILTTMEALPGNPYMGPLQFIDRPRLGIGLDAFGLQWQFTIVPPGIGTTIKSDLVYDRPLLEWREVKSDLGGTLVTGPTIDTNEAIGRHFFSEFPLVRLALYVYPGCEVNLFWILVL
jgi:hypothetical protein